MKIDRAKLKKATTEVVSALVVSVKKTALCLSVIMNAGHLEI